MRNLILTLSFTLVMFISNVWAEKKQYTCPMHPSYISEESGNCPICGMDLVALETDDEEMDVEEQVLDNNHIKETTNSNKKREILYWVAPMNPNYKMDKPGKSPMGMDLVPVYADDEDNTPSGKTKGNNQRKSVKISPETIQNMGVRTEKAEMTRFGTDIRSYGLITENVRLRQTVSSRVSGWVEDLKIKAVGDEVKKGGLLFTLYSPELVSAQQDYIAALKAKSKGRLSSTARRLHSLGLQNKFIEMLKKEHTKTQNVPFFSETSGIISYLKVNQGSYVKPGMEIATIQDYSSVWINVSLAEKDLQFLDKKSKVKVVFPNLGAIERVANIDYIYPTIDKNSRTGQIRLVLDNTDGSLKPGAYADVLFEAKIDHRLAIPAESVLKSSEGDFVVVSLGNGRFRSKKIITGVKSKGRIEVLSGLSENDNVVVSGQFLIDSESSLKESFRKMQKAQKALSDLKITNKQLAVINHLVDSAVYLHEVLTTKAEIDIRNISPVLKANKKLIAEFKGTRLQFVLEDAQKALEISLDSITDSEIKTSLGNLILALEPWLFKGKPEYYKNKGLKVFMDHKSGYNWLQMGDKPINPYGISKGMLKEWPSVQNDKFFIGGNYYA